LTGVTDASIKFSLNINHLSLAHPLLLKTGWMLEQ
jgi:hypothetical protein